MISSDNLRAHAERLRSRRRCDAHHRQSTAALTQAADYLDDLAAAVKDVQALLPAKVDAI